MNIIGSTHEHADHIAKRMRDQDVQELKKLGKTPIISLYEGLRSDECYTVIHDDVPVMMFGLHPAGLSSAVVWALGTDDVLKMKKKFIKESIIWRDSFLKDYSHLFNHVDINNFESIRWLKWLGAKFDKPKPFGKGVFMRFEFNV